MTAIRFLYNREKTERKKCISEKMTLWKGNKGENVHQIRQREKIERRERETVMTETQSDDENTKKYMIEREGKREAQRERQDFSFNSS